MTIKCSVAIRTPGGRGFAEVNVNSLHQLALVMPAAVVSYDVRDIQEVPGGAVVDDSELFDLLTGLLEDIEAGESSSPAFKDR